MIDPRIDLIKLNRLMLDILPSTLKCRTSSAEYFDVMYQVIDQLVKVSETSESTESILILTDITNIMAESIIFYDQVEIQDQIDETLCGILGSLNITLVSITQTQLELR